MFSPSRINTFLSHSSRLRLWRGLPGLRAGDGTTASALAWDAPNRTRREKLLDMTQEIAGRDRSQGEKLTNLQMVLGGIHRWLRRGYVRNSQISQKAGGEHWGCSGEWDSARTTVLGNRTSLPTQGWDLLEMVSEIPKFKFNMYRNWK